jgi:glycolate oxidase iron-sulfur subunit
MGSDSHTEPRTLEPVATPSFDTPGAPSFEKVSTCVHCGLCLEACPTYRELRVEMDSPRGRIYLMRGILQNKIPPSGQVLRHLDQCLDCRACETACPSGVQYGHILERTRTVLEPIRRRGPFARLARRFGFSLLLPSRAVQRVVFKLLWLLEAIGLFRLGAWLASKRLLPRGLAAAAVQAPHVPRRSFRDRHRAAYRRERQAFVFPARGERKHRVALLTGCLADQLFADVNEATVRVLTENGCEVEVLENERCCGALHIHNGARDQAKALARDNVRAFADRGYDALVSSAAGCSAELRHYGELLENDPAAVALGAKVRDVSEFLCEIGWTAPSRPGALTGAVAYDEPCHLLHAQKVSDPPKRLLSSIPGLTLVPLEEADACCGSAGVYSLVEPTLSQKIGDRKIAAIRRSGADIVATGNPGCLLQIGSGVRAAGLPVKVVHPIELLADAYRASAENGTTTGATG